MRTSSAALIAASLAGCATNSQDARNSLLGLSRAEILACAGAPHRQASDGNLQVITYERVAMNEGQLYQCDTSIALLDGKVDKVSYSSRATRLCAASIRNCLK